MGELEDFLTAHVYRREAGEWKIVHRHGDYVPADKGPADAAAEGLDEP